MALRRALEHVESRPAVIGASDKEDTSLENSFCHWAQGCKGQIHGDIGLC